MNRIRELRNKAGLGLGDVADAVGADLAEIALAEMGVGLIRFELGMSIARVLGAHPGEVFPGMGAFIDEINSLNEDEMREAMLEPQRAAAIADAGLDPDILPWYVIMKLRSGNERRYFVSSAEARRIKDFLGKPRGPVFVNFLSDCRHVLLRPETVAEVSFTNSASYAPFSSDESAFEVVLVSGASPRPERLDVTPDGGDEGEGPRPFAELLDTSAKGKPEEIPAFVCLCTDAGEDRFVAMDLVEVIEIPVGVVIPSIYGELLGGEHESGSLACMEVMGTA